MTALFIVVARAANGVIGRNGALPWNIPADLRHFRALTLGRPMIMGRKTFESIGRALPGRRSIVLTRQPGWSAPGAETAPDLMAALALAGDAPEAAIIGGEAVFAAALPHAARLELTEVDGAFDGDARFPDFAAEQWREVWREDHAAEGSTPAFRFRRLLRSEIPPIRPL